MVIFFLSIQLYFLFASSIFFSRELKKPFCSLKGVFLISLKVFFYRTHEGCDVAAVGNTMPIAGFHGISND